jgi:UDP-N-acetylglucosamine 2-epimerase (non-hydrolysing)
MILITYGTRPEYIKVKPLIDSFIENGIKFKTLFTGQHKTLVDNNADFNLEISNDSDNRLNNIISSCALLNDEYFKGITHVLVQGDTTSALGIALSAFNRKIDVIHLEAGLRTYDIENPYPEETNRQLIARIANIHFCPTELNYQNLINEKVQGDLHVVGNTGLDNLSQYLPMCEYGDTVLITLHRRENHDIIDEWFYEINELAKNYSDLKFILPMHPNPNVQKYKKILTNVEIIEPLAHDELIKLLIKTKLVITDSGGLQEECSFFNKKCLVCRKITERPESIGLTSFMIDLPNDLSSMFKTHIDDFKTSGNSPFGDGNASKKISEIIKNKYISDDMSINDNEICLLIPSYNRYDKLVETLTNINEYEGLNVIVYNDGSNDERYKTIESQFKNVKVVHNSKNNGKVGYNDTARALLNEGLSTNFKWFIYYADDMLLCKDFTKHIKPLFSEKNIVNIFSLHSHGWGCSAYIDGFFTMSKESVSMIHRLIPGKLKDVENKSTGVWSSVTKEFSLMRTKLSGFKLSCLNYSLCQHYGNDDSKLHPKFRLKTPIIAHNFYDDFYGEEIKIISTSGTVHESNNNIIKKKSSEGTLNGDKNIKKVSKDINNEVKIQETPKPTQAIINTPINIVKTNLKKESVPEKMQKPKTINKTHSELFMGKSMKKKLRFGRK